jgi:hypothetical protein
MAANEIVKRLREFVNMAKELISGSQEKKSWEQ